MKKYRWLSALLSASMALSMAAAAPVTAFAEEDDVEIPFTLTVEGQEITDITVTEGGYTYVDTWNETSTTVDLYTVSIPEGTETVDLAFAQNQLVYNYDVDGETWLDGWYDDATEGADTATCMVDADSNGEYDILQVQDLYVEDEEGNWSGGALIYAITFAEVKNTTDMSFTVYANGEELTNPEVIEDGYTYVDTYGGTSTTVDLYVFDLYKGIDSVDLEFAYRRLAYNYDVDGETYLDGYYDDYVYGATTATCSVDADANGTPDIIQIQNTYNEDWSGAEVLYAITFNIVDAFEAPASVKAAPVSGGIKVTWAASEGATKYQVYRKAGSGSYELVKTTKTLAYTDKDVKNGTKYTYYVVPKNGEGLLGTASKKAAYYYLSSAAITKLTSTKAGKATVKWSKNSKATGYLVYYSKNSDFSGAKKAKITSASTVSKTLSSLTKGKKYYVRVRAYKTVGSKNYYSIYSAKDTVKVMK